MKVVKRIWTGTSGAEKLLLGIAVAGLCLTVALAGYALVKRPDDISNPDAAFKTGSLGKKPEPEPESKDRSVDWPRFGYDLARTKFLNTPKVRPPYRKLWKYDQEELIEFAPIIAGKRMYLIDNDGVFVTLNKDSGKVVWKKQLASLNASSPVFWRGHLLAVTLEPGQAMSVRASDGKVNWKRPLPSRAESSPLVVGDTMYFGSESGEFFALDARTGKPKWEISLGGSVKAAPAYADGTLYVGDYCGQMYAIRAEDGAIRWQTGDLGTGLGGSGRFYSTPAVAFGRVYAGNVDGRVYSFDRQTGEIAWTFSAGDYVYSGVAAADGKRIQPSVYFGSHDKNVYALEADSGNEIWKAAPGGQVSGPATVVGDVVYVSTFSGNSTVGFDLGTGRRVFKVDDGEYGPAVSDWRPPLRDRRLDRDRLQAGQDRGLQGEVGRDGDRAALGAPQGAAEGPQAGAGQRGGAGRGRRRRRGDDHHRAARGRCGLRRIGADNQPSGGSKKNKQNEKKPSGGGSGGN